MRELLWDWFINQNSSDDESFFDDEFEEEEDEFDDDNVNNESDDDCKNDPQIENDIEKEDLKILKKNIKSFLMLHF